MMGKGGDVSVLACAIGLLYSLAICAFVVRVWARRRTRRWDVDDYAYTAAFIVAVAHAVLTSFCIANGYGHRAQELNASNLDAVQIGQRKAYYVAQLTYVLCFGLARMSCALSVSFAAHGTSLVWPARTTAALAGVWAVASVLCLALIDNADRPWTGIETKSIFFRWLGIESTGVLLELSLFILSTSVVWNIPLAPPRRLQLAAVFGIRLFLIPVISARLIFLQPLSSSAPAWTATAPTLLTEAALSLSVTIGCAVAALHPKAANVNEEEGGPTTLSKMGGGERYYRLDRLHSSPSKHGGGARALRVGRLRTRYRPVTPDLDWKPYQGFTEASEATAYPPRVHISSGRERADAGVEGGSGGRMTEPTTPPSTPLPMGIHRRTEVIIEYT
ncbi:hypothetical protein ISF_03081 [Cordyceps fumosorosea ARSEF 2679]|uniref:Rhodopsin domain-containing protein n=1 Tax=Cordyceps fumosorosea (strain ARSEF 2679) TaxID=1081104 RepID=A0A168B9K4_CORFA|nr:hypothetical protein ISF_03081 [Cordyceps fumosorosea ARSEF 2679]OAA69811.1 hypothetical protein ISF_03081 [Cordyceps fumosorosea ARSEF 2679]